MSEKIISYLLNSDEPWTRYRTQLDLLDMGEGSPEVRKDRDEMLDHPNIKDLICKAKSWPGYALKRHNDAKHPLHSLTVLADFGINKFDSGIDEVIKKILEHQSPEGVFETQIQLYKMFGGLEGEYWTWMSCDMTVLLYVLLSFGLDDQDPVNKAKSYLLSLVEENGWQCKVSPLLDKFRGPGKKGDPCPIANLYALRALSLDPTLLDNAATAQGIEMLLKHWEIQGKKKYYLFGIGTDFRKLKYPLIWYDLLHVMDVLSRYPVALKDPRYLNMMSALTDQGGEGGTYTATSMYMAWKNWSFADKKNPSPWITFLVARILKRSGMSI